MTKAFKKYLEERQRKIDTTTVNVDGVDILVKDIPDKSFTLEMREKTRANTDGWNMLIPKYTNEALIEVTNHTLANCSRFDTITYDGALNALLVPELLRRLKAREAQDNGSIH